ncbi:MAG: hypothetical protein OXC26_18730 [Albidovulum sp.]|nr:hypothetical protein [Albidovulum sp.]
MHDTGEYSIGDLAEVFSVSRPTVYRTPGRRKSPWSVIPHSARTDPYGGIGTYVGLEPLAGGLHLSERGLPALTTRIKRCSPRKLRAAL